MSDTFPPPPNGFDPNDGIPTAPAVPELPPPPAPKTPAVQTWQFWQGGAVVSVGVTVVGYIAQLFHYQLPDMETTTFVGALFAAIAAGVTMCLKATKLPDKP